MKITTIDEKEYSFLFNERCYNPPKDLDSKVFNDEFTFLVGGIRRKLIQYGFTDDDFLIYLDHNNQRFIDLCFDDDKLRYEEPAVLGLLQSLVKSMDEDWLICAWMAKFFFISKASIKLY